MGNPELGNAYFGDDRRDPAEIMMRLAALPRVAALLAETESRQRSGQDEDDQRASTDMIEEGGPVIDNERGER